MGWINTRLNDARPENAPARELTFYACGQLAHCYGFAHKIVCPNGAMKYYKVEMIDPVKAPMCLTDRIHTLGRSHSSIDAIVAEYWNPTLKWSYYEYLSAEMKIIGLVTPSMEDRVSQGAYNNDRELAQKTFK
jgi:hypothetical protein